MIPKFSGVDFVSFYIELPVLLVMSILWLIVRARLDKDTDTSSATKRRVWHDVVDVSTADLTSDEYVEVEEDRIDNDKRERHLKGKYRWFWRAYYLIA